MPTRRRSLALTLLLLPALVLPGCRTADVERSPADAARDPAPATPAFGMMAWRPEELTRADFSLLRRSGARLERFTAFTTTTDDRGPEPGIRRYDRLVAAASREGVDLLPVLIRNRPRDAAAARRFRLRERAVPPKQFADPPTTRREWAIWRARVRAYAERYGPGGHFWREHPQLPYRPFRAWEVWNEPNLWRYWNGRAADPSGYARLLRETRRVLRSVDPRARIVLAGLNWHRGGAAYLGRVLAENGGCSIDAIGVHPYAPTPAGAIGHLERARATADAHGARAVPLWTTEIGWKIGRRAYWSVPNETAQAWALDRFAAAATRRRGELGLGPIFAFVLRDRARPDTGRLLTTAGLRRADDSPRASWAVWSRWARRAEPLPLPPARGCGRQRRDAGGAGS